jgi:Contractile injection system tube protein
MALEKMTIEAFSDGKFQKRKGQPYHVLINPEEYAHKYSILHNDTHALGANGTSQEFSRMGPETVSFTIWFDRTGVVPGFPRMGGTTSLAQQIKLFKALIFTYQGDIHSPNYLVLTWGTLLFRCQLTSLDLTYTMFRPDGNPIRAKCVVSFQSYTAPTELAQKAQKASADMSHLVSVKAGDTLPLLCHQVYGTSVHYAAVARVNGLTGFRRLRPGMQLLFPPLRTPAR